MTIFRIPDHPSPGDRVNRHIDWHPWLLALRSIWKHIISWNNSSRKIKKQETKLKYWSIYIYYFNLCKVNIKQALRSKFLVTAKGRYWQTLWEIGCQPLFCEFGCQHVHCTSALKHRDREIKQLI